MKGKSVRFFLSKPEFEEAGADRACRVNWAQNPYVSMEI
jgi:hypothetical protein